MSDRIDELPINLNLELVHGCANRSCHCWGLTCFATTEMTFMRDRMLHTILADLINEPRLSNVALYGLGESLYHPHLRQIVQLLREQLPEVRLHLNTDVHMMLRKRYIPPVSFFNICHKDTVVMPPFAADYSAAEKVTHVFILSRLSLDALARIDDYIEATINLHPTQSYMLGTLWDCDFGLPPTQALKPLEIDEGIEIEFPTETPHRQCEEMHKVYIDAFGQVRRCLFSSKIHSSLVDFLANYQHDECASCQMGAYRYTIDLKGGDDNEEIQMDKGNPHEQ